MREERDSESEPPLSVRSAGAHAQIVQTPHPTGEAFAPIVARFGESMVGVRLAIGSSPMHGFTAHLGPYLVTNLLALGLVVLAFTKPRTTRWLFTALFGGAAIFNAIFALRDPGAYVSGYAKLAAPAYRDFIEGTFAAHTTPIVLSIALGQLVIAVMLALGGRSLTRGAIGAVVFLVAISPLGVGSAFPSTLILALAIAVAAIQLDERVYGEAIDVPG